MLETIAVAFFWIAVGASALQLLGALCLVIFYFQKAPPLNRNREKYPSVTMVKCCANASDNEMENFDALFRQDYPGKFEIIFTVPNDKAPACAVIEHYLQKYPEADAKMLVSKTRKAFWKKVDALYDGFHEAKGDVVIFTDSDAIVKENYLSEVVSSLEEPGTSVVTIPQYDVRVNTFGSALKVLGNTCDLATYVMIAWAFSKNPKFGWGHSMAFWKEEFQAFGPKAWDFIFKFLADDIAVPYLYVQNGKQVRFRNIECPVEFSNKTAWDAIDQKRRWVWCQRISVPNRWVYLLGLLVYPQIPATLVVLFSGFATWSLWAWLGFAGVRIFVSVLHEILFQKSIKMNLKYFWTIVLWDLLQVFFILEGFWRTTFVIDNRRFKVVDRYFLEQVPL